MRIKKSNLHDYTVLTFISRLGIKAETVQHLRISDILYADRSIRKSLFADGKIYHFNDELTILIEVYLGSLSSFEMDQLLFG